MGQLQSFNKFIDEANKQNIDPNRIATSKRTSKILSEDIENKMKTLHYHAMNEAIMYENDGDVNHKLKDYLCEYADMFASTTGLALDGNHFFDTMSTMAAQVAQGGDAPKVGVQRSSAPTVTESKLDFDIAAKRKQVKDYLDECYESMKDSYCKKMDELKKSNDSKALIIASDAKKKFENNGKR